MRSQSTDLVETQTMFENGLSDKKRKDFGVYLTNNIGTVDRILDVVDFDDPSLLSKKFLEPSCGNGVFLVRLLEKIHESRSFNEEEIRAFIESNVYFVDIDAEMIARTERNISKWFAVQFSNDFRGKFNSFQFDFTKRIRSKNKSLFDRELDVPLSQIIEKVDYVLGNPPYVTLYGRRDRKQNEEQRIYYLNRYSQFPDSLKNGKLNFVMLFIEHSMDFLRSSGKLSFIIDLAFFETAYEYTRKYLLENSKILSIDYNIKDFEVASGQVIIKVEKAKVNSNLVLITNSESKESVYVDQKRWVNKTDQYRFRFSTCNKSSEIISKIKSKNCPSLKKLYPKKNLRTCVMLLNMENKFVFAKKNEDLGVNIYPYYQGSKGLKGKFLKMQHTHFFHYNKNLQDEINDQLKEELAKKGVKNKKRLGLGETCIYDNPKVFIRQSAKEIIASYDENASAANNSLYVFSLRDSSDKSKTFLKFICGLLNSELVTFYCQQEKIIRYSKGKQPQIKTSDLYTLPIPIDENLILNVSKAVDSIYNEVEADNYKEIIDDLIYTYFGIDNEQIRIIKESIAGF